MKEDVGGGIIFDSDFDSGNLDRVERLDSPHESFDSQGVRCFHVHIRVDIATHISFDRIRLDPVADLPRPAPPH